VTAPWPHGDPRAVARAILANPRFHAGAQQPHRTLLDVIFDALHALWDALTKPLERLTGSHTVTTIVGVAVLCLSLALFVVVIVRFVRAAQARRAPRPIAGVEAQRLSDEADSATLHARALAAFAAGRLHEAAALFWISALRALDERGRVRFDAARSPREWRRAVRDPAFDALARDAVVALFGDREIEPDLVTRMRDAYDRVVPA
jgi:hypothetical protein